MKGRGEEREGNLLGGKDYSGCHFVFDRKARVRERSEVRWYVTFHSTGLI